MTTKGRPRKDELERTGHRRAVGQDDAIEVAPVEERLVSVAPPDDMLPLAAEIWDVVVADMIALGHLREPDLMQVRNYAVEIAVAIEAEAAIKEHGAMMKQPITAMDPATGDEMVVGYKLIANPATKLHREASNAARLMAAELGLMPLARIRGNLMAAATASIALGIKDEIDAELDAEDDAKAKATHKPRKRAAKKKPALPPGVEGMTVAQLRELSGSIGVDLGGVRRKAEMLEALIKAAR